MISLPFNDMFFGHPAQAKAEQAWESCAVSLCQSATSTVVCFLCCVVVISSAPLQMTHMSLWLQVYAMSSNHFPQISQPKAVVDAIKVHFYL